MSYGSYRVDSGRLLSCLSLACVVIVCCKKILWRIFVPAKYSHLLVRDGASPNNNIMLA